MRNLQHLRGERYSFLHQKVCWKKFLHHSRRHPRDVIFCAANQPGFYVQGAEPSAASCANVNIGQVTLLEANAFMQWWEMLQDHVNNTSSDWSVFFSPNPLIIFHRFCCSKKTWKKSGHVILRKIRSDVFVCIQFKKKCTSKSPFDITYGVPGCLTWELLCLLRQVGNTNHHGQKKFNTKSPSVVFCKWPFGFIFPGV